VARRQAVMHGALYDWVGRGSRWWNARQRVSSGTALGWMDYYWTCTASTKMPLVKKAPFVECIRLAVRRMQLCPRDVSSTCTVCYSLLCTPIGLER
jgi:hypothetical protein